MPRAARPAARLVPAYTADCAPGLVIRPAAALL
jgi:hypothetical protein